MRQRIQIAKALTHGADVLLLDEPFVGVEHGVRGRILELLERLRAEAETAVVVAARDPDVAARLPTRSWCWPTARWWRRAPPHASSSPPATTGPVPCWRTAAPPDFGPGTVSPDAQPGCGSGRWSRKVPVARLIEAPVAVADGGLAVGDLPGHADDLARARRRPRRGGPGAWSRSSSRGCPGSGPGRPGRR